MKELILLTLLSGFVFILFLVLLIHGLIKKQQKKVLISAFLFIAFLGLCGITGFKLISKSIYRITEIFNPRTGDEIYDALFGKRQSNCVRIINFQDQVVPKIDYAIWLHIETCPNELERILNLHNFESKIVFTKGWNTEGPFANDNWFKQESLGDSVLVFKYNKDDYGNAQIIYSSLDSTVVFVQDIQD